MKKTINLKPTKFDATSVSNVAEKFGSGERASRKLLKCIDVEVEVNASVLEQLAVGPSIDYQQTFFESDGTPRDLAMGRVPYKSEFNDQIVIFSQDGGKIGASDFTSKKIHKFAASFSAGGIVKLHMQIQIYPDGEAEHYFIDSLLVDQKMYIEILPGVQRDFAESHDAKVVRL